MHKLLQTLGTLPSHRVFHLTLGWAVILLIIGYVANLVLPFAPTYPYFDAILAPLAPAWLARWGGFDGVHYITIATQGYVGIGLVQAFFPVYPLLIHVLNVLHNPLFTGIMISYLCLVLAAIIFNALPSYLQKGHTQKLDMIRLIALFTFPTSFFFLGLYTESLFFLLVVSSWYCAEKKRWGWAALLAGVASGTRIVGIALFPALLFQAYMDHRAAKHHGVPWRAWLTLCVSAIGLISYMVYLQLTFHDPLFFMHVQSGFGGGRQDDLILFPQVVYRYIKILLTARPFDWTYYAYVQELVLTLEVGVVLALMTIRKSLRHIPFLIYSWIMYLVPPLTGTFGSMPRYVLVIFPIYFVFAEFYRKHKGAATLLFVVHAILLVINILLFIQGKWVA